MTNVEKWARVLCAPTPELDAWREREMPPDARTQKWAQNEAGVELVPALRRSLRLRNNNPIATVDVRVTREQIVFKVMRTAKDASLRVVEQTVYTFTIYDADDVPKAVSRMRAELREKGYYNGRLRSHLR
jgi:hypothetical protein